MTSKPSLTNCPKLSLYVAILAVYFQRDALYLLLLDYVNLISGGYSGRVPPLPIPNREVKPARADGTAHPWESR